MPSVLRIKNPDGTWYEVTALKGDTGITPNLQVGTVTTGNPGTSAEVTITGTPEEPVLNFKIPKGEPGTGGDGGANIDDTTPSTSTTYSSSKIESKLTALNDANAALIEVSKTKPNAENTELWIHPNADEVQLPQINDSMESEQDTWSSKKIAAAVSNKANEKDLAVVAKSGSYNDLTNKPTIPAAYTLPIASPTQLGGVMPAAKTDEMTQAVGVDAQGGLWALPGGEKDWTKICGGNITEEVASITIDANADGTPISNLDINETVIFGRIYLTGNSGVRYEYNGLWTSGNYFSHSKLGAWSHPFIIHIVRYLDRWCVEYNGGSSSAVITPAGAFTSFEMHTETDGVLFNTGTNLNVYYR